MRRLAAVALAALLSAALPGCNRQTTAEAPPPPHALPAGAIAHFCGMRVAEHPGPKGQILLAGKDEPVWFASARDAVAFTMLPEEPRDIRAVYVSDMAKAESWEKPGAENWVDAHKASFVIDSARTAGMGGSETIPFSDEEAARAFVGRYGGRIVRFDQIPRDYVLGGQAASPATEPAAPEHEHHAH